MNALLVVLTLVSLVLGVLVLRMLLKSPAGPSSGEWKGNRRQWFIVLPLLALDIALMVFLIVRDYRLLFQILGVLHLIAVLYVASGRKPPRVETDGNEKR